MPEPLDSHQPRRSLDGLQSAKRENVIKVARGIREDRQQVVKEQILQNRELQEQVSSLEKDLAEVKLKLAEKMLDPLTQVLRREEGLRILDAILESNTLNENSLDGGVIILDIDKFKDVNDTHGHLGGDAVLRSVALEVAEQLRTILRDTDFVSYSPKDGDNGGEVSRYGGEEFLLVVTGVEKGQLLPLGNRLRDTIEKHAITIIDKDGKEVVVHVTISIGITPLKKGESSEEHIRKADSALYGVKSNEIQSRNGVLLYEDDKQLTKIKPVRLEIKKTNGDSET